MKRLFDVGVSAVALILTSPIVLAAAVASKVDSPGPAFYVATRVGIGGRTFRIFKIRTMRVSAGGPGVTAGDDPRITRVGRFLRRTKIDELPQLLNVLVGDMSLVGPRPEDPAYVSLYTPEQRGVLSMRPGITGPAVLDFIDEEEVLRGGDAEATYVKTVMPQKLAADLQYVRSASFTGDLRLIGRTFATLLKRTVKRGSAERRQSPPR